MRLSLAVLFCVAIPEKFHMFSTLYPFLFFVALFLGEPFRIKKVTAATYSYSPL